MRIRSAFAAVALAGAAFTGLAADDAATTVYFQMEGPCNETPPRVLTLEQTEEYSGDCFPIEPGTVGQAGSADEVYGGSRKVFDFAVTEGSAIAGQFAFTNFGAAVFGSGGAVGVMNFSIEVTAKIDGKTVVIASYTEENRVVAGNETIFEFTGEIPASGVLAGMNATVSASGNTTLGMGFSHSNSFFTIG